MNLKDRGQKFLSRLSIKYIEMKEKPVMLRMIKILLQFIKITSAVNIWTYLEAKKFFEFYLNPSASSIKGLTYLLYFIQWVHSIMPREEIGRDENKILLKYVYIVFLSTQKR